MTDDRKSYPQVVREAMAELTELTASVVDAAEGHRAALERAGFSPTAAEHGALVFHAHAMSLLMQALTQGQTR